MTPRIRCENNDGIEACFRRSRVPSRVSLFCLGVGASGCRGYRQAASKSGGHLKLAAKQPTAVAADRLNSTS
jgi:hypothetical protein